MQGVKNEKGVWITPAFPKLIYVLDEDNITEDSKYWELDRAGCKMYSKTYGSGLYFRKDYAGTETGRSLPVYGLPFIS